jgi:hypothetical protein
VATEQLTANDFLSGEAEGRNKPPGFDACRWKAASFFLPSVDRQKLIDIVKLPKHAHKKLIAFVQVGPDAGRAKPHEKDNTHISVWLFTTFNPHQHIQKFEALISPGAVQ